MTSISVPAAALTIDWPALMRFKPSMIDSTPQRTEQAWAKIGVEQFHGRARFVDSTTLAVGDDRLIGRRVLIAAALSPIPHRRNGRLESVRLAQQRESMSESRLKPR